MSTLDSIKAGLQVPGCPFDSELRCKGCGRYIGLWNRDGVLVAMEYHAYNVTRVWDTVTERGFQGPGMFKARREPTCQERLA